MVAHGRQCRIGLLRRHCAYELALVGEIERIQSQDLAEPAHFAAKRRAVFVDFDADPRRFRKLVQHGGDAAARGVAHAAEPGAGGVAAARSLLAGRQAATPFTPIPYFWSDQYGIRFQVLGNPGGTDQVEIVDGSFAEGKFVALYGRADRLRAIMAVGKPRQLMGFRPLLETGVSWSEALAHANS